MSMRTKLVKLWVDRESGAEPKVFAGDAPAAWLRALAAHQAATADAAAHNRDLPPEPKLDGRLVSVQADLRRAKESATNLYYLFREAENMDPETLQALFGTDPDRAGRLQNALQRVKVHHA